MQVSLSTFTRCCAVHVAAYDYCAHDKIKNGKVRAARYMTQHSRLQCTDDAIVCTRVLAFGDQALQIHMRSRAVHAHHMCCLKLSLARAGASKMRSWTRLAART